MLSCFMGGCLRTGPIRPLPICQALDAEVRSHASLYLFLSSVWVALLWFLTAIPVRGGIELRLNVRLHSEIAHLLDVNWDARWLPRKVEHYRQLYKQAQGHAPPGWWAWTLSLAGLTPELPQPPRPHLLFVYGTLKSGFHWNKKYLSIGAELVGPCTTRSAMPLVVGESGVPYMLAEAAPGSKEQAARVTGELWRIDDECLAGLDEVCSLVLLL